MNIQNIILLTKTLKQVGLNESIGKQLLQQVSFKPLEFSLTERINREKDLLFCIVSFQRKDDEYTCVYYDVSLLKNVEMPDKLIESINIKDLDLRMSQIDWRFSVKLDKQFDLSDESTWERERNVERVVTELAQLSLNEEGRYFAEFLKLKYWSGYSMNPFAGNLNSFRSRYEISQRFYFIGGQGISIEEAYRFLLNRWMEKQQSLKSKKTNGASDGDLSGGGIVNTAPSLPKTKKVRRKK